MCSSSPIPLNIYFPSLRAWIRWSWERPRSRDRSKTLISPHRSTAHRKNIEPFISALAEGRKNASHSNRYRFRKGERRFHRGGLGRKNFQRFKPHARVGAGQRRDGGTVDQNTAGERRTAIIVSSSRYGRALELAEDLGAEAFAYDEYENHMDKIDIVLVSTSAPHVLIREEQVHAWMKRRHDKPLFLIDISMPRNVEPSIGKLDNVYLFNIDDLQGIAQKNLALRESQLEECGRLVQTQTQYFMDWLRKSYV